MAAVLHGIVQPALYRKRYSTYCDVCNRRYIVARIASIYPHRQTQMDDWDRGGDWGPSLCTADWLFLVSTRAFGVVMMLRERLTGLLAPHNQYYQKAYLRP